jgi:hypothetical protein
MLIEIEKLLNGGSHSFTLKENVQISGESPTHFLYGSSMFGILGYKKEENKSKVSLENSSLSSWFGPFEKAHFVGA